MARGERVEMNRDRDEHSVSNRASDDRVPVADSPAPRKPVSTVTGMRPSKALLVEVCSSTAAAMTRVSGRNGPCDGGLI